MPSLAFRAKEKLICCQARLGNVVETSTGGSVCKGTIPTWKHNQAGTFPQRHLPRGTPWFPSRGNCQLPPCCPFLKISSTALLGGALHQPCHPWMPPEHKEVVQEALE